MSILRRSRQVILKISPAEVSVHRRGFRVSEPEIAKALERIGQEFVGGYHVALEEESVTDLGRRLDAGTEPRYRGFAFEGAAMALTLLDHLSLRGGRFEAFLSGPGDPHTYMGHVGAGWAVARLPWLRLRLSNTLNQFHPMGRWLVMDGYGFHEGYFHWKSSIARAEQPRGLTGYAARAFDQGLGRSLWFVDGMDVARIPQTIEAFPAMRHADLWSGVGLACAYAGGAGAVGVERLGQCAGRHRGAFQQGIAFAAKARIRAQTPVEHLDSVCRVACRMPAAVLADLCDETLRNLPADGAEPAYEIWRQRIQLEFTGVRR
jgi:enediyne biosynthesis protein E3